MRVTRCIGLLMSGLVVVLVWTLFMQEDVGAADIRLELERSSFDRIPVAVFPFQMDKGVPLLGFSSADVLKNDLKRSQLFRIKNIDGVDGSQGKSPTPSLVQRVSMSGVTVAVWAQISRRGDTFVLDAYLFEGDAGRKALHQRYIAQSKWLVRAMIHRMSNMIIERYSGQKGVAGTKIAFVAEADNGKQLYVMDYDGYGKHQVTNVSTDGRLNLFPQWSPAIGESGKRFLAFTSYLNENPDIHVMDLVTGKRNHLIVYEGNNLFPAWSPDGEHLAFAASFSGNSEIYTVQAGKEMFTDPKLRKLTLSPAADFSPTWSPDGRKIAFASDRGGSVQLYVMDDDGSNLRRLTWEGRDNTAPAWSPDGRWIAYTCRIGRKFKICRVTPDGRDPVQVTHSPGDHESASWSPDGRHLVFSVTDRGKSHIYGVHYDGSGFERLTSGVSRASSPAWSPWIP